MYVFNVMANQSWQRKHWAGQTACSFWKIIGAAIDEQLVYSAWGAFKTQFTRKPSFCLGGCLFVVSNLGILFGTLSKAHQPNTRESRASSRKAAGLPGATKTTLIHTNNHATWCVSFCKGPKQWWGSFRFLLNARKEEVPGTLNTKTHPRHGACVCP